MLLLSAAGVQALMSFTIAQRTREIGIRSALGAPPRQLLLGIFGRAMRQLGIGVLVGSLLSIAAFVAASGVGLSDGNDPIHISLGYRHRPSAHRRGR